MQTVNFILLCIVTLCLEKKVEGLTCLSCEKFPHPRFCQVATRCAHGEVCFTKTVTAVDGFKAFTMGCKAATHTGVCNSTVPGSNNCQECCNTDLCNAELCGERGYPQQRGPICYSCKSRLLNEPCNALTMCQVGEVCSISQKRFFSELVYTSGCSDKQVCQAHTHGSQPVVGKRDVGTYPSDVDADDVGTCNQCCNHDVCNVDCSAAVKSPCDSMPCNNNGTCSDTLNGYTCACTAGYAGKNCEIDTRNYYFCTELLKAGITESGVYTMPLPWTSAVNPFSNSKDSIKVPVVCDMTTDGGGWMVIQHRFDGSVDFFRNLTEYEDGFGDPYGEYWQGFVSLFYWTIGCGNIELRIDMEDFKGVKYRRVFYDFSVSGPPKYTLSIKPGNSPDGHGLMENNGSDFYTFDHDTNNTCAAHSHSGWWFNDGSARYHSCRESRTNLNGEYIQHGSNSSPRGIFYENAGDTDSIKSSKMMIRIYSSNCN